MYGANSVLISMCFTVVIVKCRFREYQNRNSWRLLGNFFCRKWRMHVEIWSHITIFGRQCDYFGRYVQHWWGPCLLLEPPQTQVFCLM